MTLQFITEGVPLGDSIRLQAGILVSCEEQLTQRIPAVDLEVGI